MAISEEKNEWLTAVLQDLEPELKHMKPVPRGFVEDQIKRHSQYGDRIFISPKQEKWLRDLHQEYCGGEPSDLNPRLRDEDDEQDGDPRGELPDIDDEIKF